MRHTRKQGPRKVRGAALTEYGLIVGLVVVSTIGAVYATGDKTREIFCTTSNSLASATKGSVTAGCDDGSIAPVELGPNERLVDAPVTIAGDFGDVLYPNSETGERVVMTSLSGGAPAAFWFDTEIASRDAHEPSREISACYMTSQAPAPICGLPGAFSSVSVPAGASAFGYAVSLSENRVMPWANDVSISVPAADGIEAQSWSVQVAREDGPPSYEVSFSMDDKVFEKEDTDWTYASAEIIGAFNVPLNFHLSPSTGYQPRFRGCYAMEIGGSPICDAGPFDVDGSRYIEVPIGAKEVGIRFELPAPVVSNTDVLMSFPLALRTTDTSGSQLIHSDTVTFARPNTPIVRDVTFSMDDEVFETEDTGWAYASAEIVGEFNAPLFFHLSPSTEYQLRFRGCYAMEIGGSRTCDTAAFDIAGPRYIEVPVGAKEVAIAVQLPDPVVSDTDVLMSFPLALRTSSGTGSELLASDTVNLTRPNTRVIREVSFSMEDKVFEAEDTGWAYASAEIVGEFNVPLYFHLSPSTGYQPRFRGCYAMEIGGSRTCDTGPFDVKGSRYIKVPVGAKEIAVSFELPATSVSDTDVLMSFPLALRTTSGTGSEILASDTVNITRPNTPIIRDVTIVGFEPVLTAEDTSWTYVPVADVVGDYNKAVYFHSTYGTASKAYWQNCYWMEVGGSPTCDGNAVSKTSTRWQAIPVGAKQIGIRIQLPAATTSDWLANFPIRLRTTTATNSELLGSHTINILRPGTGS